jgi:uncharacterized cupin superfamily protein
VTDVVNLLDYEVADQGEPAGFRHLRVFVGRELGGELIGCSVYELPPGERAWPYHWHVNNEEWLLVVSGTPTLRTAEGERELAPGDVVGFPEGRAGAHDVSNRSSEAVRVAIFSTMRPGDSVYPDSDKLGAGPDGDRRYFPRSAAVGYWDGELLSESPDSGDARE